MEVACFEPRDLLPAYKIIARCQVAPGESDLTGLWEHGYKVPSLYPDAADMDTKYVLGNWIAG